MKIKLNKLKNDSQEIISNLQATVDSLIKIAYEYQTENEKLMAEIEELRKGFTADADYFASEYDSKIKSEAIKEFAERFTDKADLIKVNAFDSKWAISQEDIDNLVKEMVGDSDA